MKKRIIAVIGVILLAGIMSTVPATAHFSCNAHSGVNRTSDGGSVLFSGDYDCLRTPHDNMSVTVKAQRRPGNGSTWTTVTTVNDPCTNCFFTDASTTLPWNCDKDYRTETSGTASPGGHSGSKVSVILQNTC